MVTDPQNPVRRSRGSTVRRSSGCGSINDPVRCSRGHCEAFQWLPIHKTRRGVPCEAFQWLWIHKRLGEVFPGLGYGSAIPGDRCPGVSGGFGPSEGRHIADARTLSHQKDKTGPNPPGPLGSQALPGGGRAWGLMAHGRQGWGDRLAGYPSLSSVAILSQVSPPAAPSPAKPRT